ncbi:Kelch-like protein 20 [Symbiodinium microadriaticum]|uniref:Kelch-like protein 20 n=1 Tax=Symbiodinium microadriaticum TaxID=2951 RepID=A0A1Q9DGE2_SYMMI|nr:Kelch-like protein 20 [Symbiodinium microadriaticum]
MGVHAGYGGLHPRAILGEVLKRQQINDKEARRTSHDLALAVCSLSEPASAGQLCTCSKALRRAIHKALKELKRERLYVVGGLDDSFTPLNAVERFDPADGSWESLPPINTARHGVCLAVVGGQLYVIGGELRGVALADVQRFNPWGIQQWETLPPMSVGRIKAAAFECQGYLYVLGGHDGFNALCSVEQFHPRTQKWQEVTPMQKPRYACSATCAEGRIIVFGGELTEAGAAATFEVFDSKVGMWQLYPSVRSPLCGSVSIIGEAGEVYNFGGLGLSGQALTFAERAALNETAKPRLMFGKQTWTPLPPMPTARQQMSACMFQDGAVVVGGKSITSQASSSVEFYSISGGWQELPPLPTARIRTAVISGHL